MPKILNIQFEVADEGQEFSGCSLYVVTEDGDTYTSGGYCYGLEDSVNTYKKLVTSLVEKYPELEDVQ